MTFEQWQGLLRHAATTVGGYLAAHGWINGSEWESQIVPALMVLVGAGWSWWAKHRAA